MVPGHFVLKRRGVIDVSQHLWPRHLDLTHSKGLCDAPWSPLPRVESCLDRAAPRLSPHRVVEVPATARDRNCDVRVLIGCERVGDPCDGCGIGFDEVARQYRDEVVAGTRP